MSVPQRNTYTVTVKKYIILLRITFNLKFEQPLTTKLIDIFDVKYYVVNFDLSRLFINS